MKIEEPVKQLLKDYARFIESAPDHVVNIIVKRNPWRDGHYHNWREEQRTRTFDARKGEAAEKG